MIAHKINQKHRELRTNENYMKRPYSSLLNFVGVQIEVALRIVVEAAELLQLRMQRLEHRSRIKYSSNKNKSIK